MSLFVCLPGRVYRGSNNAINHHKPIIKPIIPQKNHHVLFGAM